MSRFMHPLGGPCHMAGIIGRPLVQTDVCLNEDEQRAMFAWIREMDLPPEFDVRAAANLYIHAMIGRDIEKRRGGE